MFLHIEHTALSVSNLDRSLAFYRDLIGMKVVMEIDFADETLGQINGLTGCKARVVHLQLGDTVLELFQYRQPEGRPIAQGRRQCDTGFIHICFRVTDIQRLHDDLETRGVKFFSPPREIRPGTFIAYFQGPDGEVCEMRQVPPQHDP